jgi:hypothetical protein
LKNESPNHPPSSGGQAIECKQMKIARRPCDAARRGATFFRFLAAGDPVSHGHASVSDKSRPRRASRRGARDWTASGTVRRRPVLPAARRTEQFESIRIVCKTHSCRQTTVNQIGTIRNVDKNHFPRPTTMNQNGTIRNVKKSLAPSQWR